MEKNTCVAKHVYVNIQGHFYIQIGFSLFQCKNKDKKAEQRWVNIMCIQVGEKIDVFWMAVWIIVD